MGVVYRATHLLLERTVALKLIAPSLASNPAFRSRFEREWRLLAALEHPNVIDIYEAGEDEGRLVSVHALGRGRRPRPAAARDDGARAEGRARHPRPGRGGARRRPRARRRAPRHQARQRPARRRPRVADRLRRGQGPRGGATRARRPGQWVGTVDYVAPELLDGKTATPRCRRLLARLRAVRGAHRPRPVRARERGRDAVGAPLPAAAEDHGGARRAAARARRRAAAGAGQGPGGAAGERGRGAPGRPRRGDGAAPGAATVVAGDTARRDAAVGTPRRRSVDTVNDPREQGAHVRRLAAAAARRRRGAAGRRRCRPSASRSRATARRARPRDRRRLAPFVERIELGEGANDGPRRGRHRRSPSSATGRTARSSRCIPSSRKVFRRIKLRSPPHDIGPHERRRATCGSRSRTAGSPTSRSTAAKVTYARLDIEARRSRSPATTWSCIANDRRRAVPAAGRPADARSRSASGSRSAARRSTSTRTARA